MWASEWASGLASEQAWVWWLESGWALAVLVLVALGAVLAVWVSSGVWEWRVAV